MSILTFVSLWPVCPLPHYSPILQPPLDSPCAPVSAVRLYRPVSSLGSDGSSDGRGAGVSTSSRATASQQASTVSCVVPPVSSCPLTVSPTRRHRGHSHQVIASLVRPPVIPTPASAVTLNSSHYTPQCP